MWLRPEESGIELVGPNGLLSQLTKRVLETALEAEMSDHLGYDKLDLGGPESVGNSRNGVRSKTVLIRDRAGVDIEVPSGPRCLVPAHDRQGMAAAAHREGPDRALLVRQEG